MAIERVKRAIIELEKAINDGEHLCDVHIEHLGDMKEVSFYLDWENEEPIATLTVVPCVEED